MNHFEDCEENIQDVGLNNYGFEQLLNLALDSYEKQEYEGMLLFAGEAKRRNPYHLMTNYLSAIANSCTGHWLESYADLRHLQRLQNIYEESVVSEEELHPMIMQARKMVQQKDNNAWEEKCQQTDAYYDLLQQSLFTSFKLIDGYFRPLFLNDRFYYMAGYFSWGGLCRSIRSIEKM